MDVTDNQRRWLHRIGEDGHWPDRPFLADKEASLPLMRLGLVEVVKPAPPYLPYARLTRAGYDRLEALLRAEKPHVHQKRGINTT